MLGLLSFVGSKIGRMIVIALVVGLILFATTRYIQNTTRDNTVKEIQIETLEDYRETRERVDNAIRETRRSNPDNSGSVALERLRNRQQDN